MHLSFQRDLDKNNTKSFNFICTVEKKETTKWDDRSEKGNSSFFWIRYLSIHTTAVVFSVGNFEFHSKLDKASICRFCFACTFRTGKLMANRKKWIRGLRIFTISNYSKYFSLKFFMVNIEQHDRNIFVYHERFNSIRIRFRHSVT